MVAYSGPVRFLLRTKILQDRPISHRKLVLHGRWKLEPDSGYIHIKLPKDNGGAHIGLAVSETSRRLALEVVALEDEMLKVRVIEELHADDAELAHDENISVAFFRSMDIWPRSD
jgi:hypothetical protein